MIQYNTKGPICLVYMLKLLINVIRAIECTLHCVCLCIYSMGNNWNNKLFVAEGIIARFALMSNACVDQYVTAF